MYKKVNNKTKTSKNKKQLVTDIWHPKNYFASNIFTNKNISKAFLKWLINEYYLMERKIKLLAVFLKVPMRAELPLSPSDGGRGSCVIDFL